MQRKVVSDNALLDIVLEIYLLLQNDANGIESFPWVEHVEDVFELFFEICLYLQVWSNVRKISCDSM